MEFQEEWLILDLIKLIRFIIILEDALLMIKEDLIYRNI